MKKFNRSLCVVAGLAALLAAAPLSKAVYVHTSDLPSGLDPSFNKDTSPYLYLEAEAAGDAPADTFADSRDAPKTAYSTDGTLNQYWGAGPAYDGARYAGLFGGNANVANASAYWSDPATSLPAGQYDVFVRALPSGSPDSTETFNLYTGTDQASTKAAASAGSVTTTNPGETVWYKVARVDLGSGIDSFRLGVDTNDSTLRFDTVFFAAVPEPAGLGLCGAAGMLMLGRRRAVRCVERA